MWMLDCRSNKVGHVGVRQSSTSFSLLFPPALARIRVGAWACCSQEVERTFPWKKTWNGPTYAYDVFVLETNQFVFCTAVLTLIHQNVIPKSRSANWCWNVFCTSGSREQSALRSDVSDDFLLVKVLLKILCLFGVHLLKLLVTFWNLKKLHVCIFT